jgi:hypothetical protein
MNKNLDTLYSLLHDAEKLASEFTGGYSFQFNSAEDFHIALKDSIEKLLNGDNSQLEILRFWFLPTSCWDIFVGSDGSDLANKIYEQLNIK